MKKTETEIMDEVWTLHYQQCQAAYPGCSPDMFSERASSISGNVVTLRNGRYMLCQYVMRKDGGYSKMR